MGLSRVIFGEDEALSSYFFVSEHGWPVVGPFSSLEPAGATLAWIRAHLAERPARGRPPAPSAEDVARFRVLWDAAVFGRVRVQLWTGRARGRRWVRRRPICHALDDLDPGWRTAIELAVAPPPRAFPRDEAGPNGEVAEIGALVGVHP